MKKALIISILLLLAGQLLAQFPAGPTYRIRLGQVTKFNYHLLALGDGAPAFTPVADTNAYTYIDTTALLLYTYSGGSWSTVGGGAGITNNTSDNKVPYYESATGSWENSPFTVDTANNRIGLNDATPSFAFDVTGAINATGNIISGGNFVAATVTEDATEEDLVVWDSSSGAIERRPLSGIITTQPGLDHSGTTAIDISLDFSELGTLVTWDGLDYLVGTTSAGTEAKGTLNEVFGDMITSDDGSITNTINGSNLLNLQVANPAPTNNTSTNYIPYWDGDSWEDSYFKQNVVFGSDLGLGDGAINFTLRIGDYINSRSGNIQWQDTEEALKIFTQSNLYPVSIEGSRLQVASNLILESVTEDNTNTDLLALDPVTGDVESRTVASLNIPTVPTNNTTANHLPYYDGDSWEDSNLTFTTSVGTGNFNFTSDASNSAIINAYGNYINWKGFNSTGSTEYIRLGASPSESFFRIENATHNFVISNFNGSSVTTNRLTFENGANTVDAYFSSVNLGVNTSTPAYTFDANGTGRFTGDLTLESVTEDNTNTDLLALDPVTGEVESVDMGALSSITVTGYTYLETTDTENGNTTVLTKDPTTGEVEEMDIDAIVSGTQSNVVLTNADYTVSFSGNTETYNITCTINSSAPDNSVITLPAPSSSLLNKRVRVWCKNDGVAASIVIFESGSKIFRAAANSTTSTLTEAGGGYYELICLGFGATPTYYWAVSEE